MFVVSAVPTFSELSLKFGTFIPGHASVSLSAYNSVTSFWVQGSCSEFQYFYKDLNLQCILNKFTNYAANAHLTGI